MKMKKEFIKESSDVVYSEEEKRQAQEDMYESFREWDMVGRNGITAEDYILGKINLEKLLK